MRHAMPALQHRPIPHGKYKIGLYVSKVFPKLSSRVAGRGRSSVKIAGGKIICLSRLYVNGILKLPFVISQGFLKETSINKHNFSVTVNLFHLPPGSIDVIDINLSQKSSLTGVVDYF